MISRSVIVMGVAVVLFCGIFVADRAQGASAPKLNPLEEIIEGAKKEGTVTVRLRTGFTENSMARLEREIKEKFGVDLKIKFAPSSSMTKDLAAALMELKVGAPPSYDLMTLSNDVLGGGDAAGLFERVDWKKIITKDINPDVVLDTPTLFGAIVAYSTHLGMMYNPQRVSPDRMPKTLRELADPKWKGKIGLARGTGPWARRAFIMGKEQVFAGLRAALKNGAIVGQYADLQTRYLLGEIWMTLSTTAYMQAAIDKGVQTGWGSLDFAEVYNSSLSVRKGAKSSNAAKLVALYLAGPQGAKFTFEESKAGNMHYPGNYEYDIVMQDKKQGVRTIIAEMDPKIVQFQKTDEYERWRNEIDLIQKMGGM